MVGGKTKRGAERRRALMLLFEMDIRGCSSEEALLAKKRAGENTPGEFGMKLVRGVEKKRDAIDELIGKYSCGWEVGRMGGLDRNILRMAAFELLCMDDVPSGSTINEAVNLAKTYCGEDSRKFINGILGRIERDIAAGKCTRACLRR
ncbi:MAG: transcription antitermination factor NusB [Actinomycetota bacterium]|nr:transcription antitermination factor NusB [Actinomycetota bacterium]